MCRWWWSLTFDAGGPLAFARGVPASRRAWARAAAAFAGQSPVGDCYFRLTQNALMRLNLR